MLSVNFGASGDPIFPSIPQEINSAEEPKSETRGVDSVVTGVIVDETHAWNNEMVGQRSHKVRLDSGKLLNISVPLFRGPLEPGSASTPLRTLYGEGVGHRVDIGLAWDNVARTKATVVSVKDLGVAPSFPKEKLFRDRGLIPLNVIKGRAPTNF